jgi:peptidoglycan/xylan/chitin deacetylase (PgdA/CDA1 family)
MHIPIQKNIPILMYHSISQSSNPRFRQFTVSPAMFTEQMAYLSDHQYTPLTVTQLIQTRSNPSSLPEYPVVLTFDDGFLDFFTVALPILKHYKFTATLYVSTAFVGGTSRWLRHEKETTQSIVTWEQLSEISGSGIECGAHSHSHPQLDTLSFTRAHDEIVRSKHLLEDHLNQAVHSFAYPYGYYTAQVQRLVQEASYTSACAVRHVMSTERDNPFCLGRLMVGADTSLEKFATLLTARSSSPVTSVYNMYLRTRTPIWQFVRKGAAFCKKGG